MKQQMSSDGNNFGLNGCYEYNEFEIDSFDALQSNNTDYAITDWPRVYFGKPLDNIVAVKVLEATIPFTFYTINSTNNTFTLNETAPVVTGTVTITPGTYYNINELATALQTALESLAGSGKTYTVTYDDNTLKFTITVSSGTFTITPGSSQIAYILGLTPTGANASTATILVTPNVARRLGQPYLYLNSRSLGAAINLFLNGDGIINASGTGADGPQICMIPINAEFGENITYTDPDPQKWFYLGTQNMQGTLDFYLTHGTANERTPLAMNGAGFSLKLGLLQSKMTGNETLPSTQQNHRVTSRTWQAGSSRMLF